VKSLSMAPSLTRFLPTESVNQGESLGECLITPGLQRTEWQPGAGMGFHRFSPYPSRAVKTSRAVRSRRLCWRTNSTRRISEELKGCRAKRHVHFEKEGLMFLLHI
jgi:hypothetical protein